MWYCGILKVKGVRSHVVLHIPQSVCNNAWMTDKEEYFRDDSQKSGFICFLALSAFSYLRDRGGATVLFILKKKDSAVAVIASKNFSKQAQPPERKRVGEREREILNSAPTSCTWATFITSFIVPACCRLWSHQHAHAVQTNKKIFCNGVSLSAFGIT